MYLLDTNLVSELRRIRSGNADPYVARWADSVDAGALYLSSIAIMELEIGVLRIERRYVTQGALLRSWLENQVLVEFNGRVLPIDTAVARRCAGLHLPNPRSERDALVAATALVHRLTVATRNVNDFRSTGVPVINPWQAIS
jgi:predicted nucleic acid-binding protein